MQPNLGKYLFKKTKNVIDNDRESVLNYKVSAGVEHLGVAVTRSKTMCLRNRYAKASAFVGMVVWALIAIPSAQATSVLQLYVEGATYDNKSESWVAEGDEFRLWTIGNVAGPGGKGTIEDVRLSVAYDDMFGQLQINLAPTTTDGFGGFTDPSTPIDPSFLQFEPDAADAVPIFGNGMEMPTHEAFGPGISWQEFSLGDFDLTDSPVGDFITSLPSALDHPDSGQINVYTVTVLAEDGNTASDEAVLHFDLYNHVASANHVFFKFAPFSHDATVHVPVPSAAWAGLSLFFSLAVVGIVRRRFGQKPAAGRLSSPQ